MISFIDQVPRLLKESLYNMCTVDNNEEYIIRSKRQEQDLQENLLNLYPISNLVHEFQLSYT